MAARRLSGARRGRARGGVGMLIFPVAARCTRGWTAVRARAVAAAARARTVNAQRVLGQAQQGLGVPLLQRHALLDEGEQRFHLPLPIQQRVAQGGEAAHAVARGGAARVRHRAGARRSGGCLRCAARSSARCAHVPRQPRHDGAANGVPVLQAGRTGPATRRARAQAGEKCDDGRVHPAPPAARAAAPPPEALTTEQAARHHTSRTPELRGSVRQRRPRRARWPPPPGRLPAPPPPGPPSPPHAAGCAANRPHSNVLFQGSVASASVQLRPPHAAAPSCSREPSTLARNLV
jgi:hypothetical protein